MKRLAKARAQAMELEIAVLIPEAQVVTIEQRAAGSLFSCGSTQHNWLGGTTVTVAPGTESEPIVIDIETHYRERGVEVSVDRDIAGKYRIQIRPPAPGENSIVVEGSDPDEIWIESGSACFTLPEGVYLGSDF